MIERTLISYLLIQFIHEFIFWVPKNVHQLATNSIGYKQPYDSSNS